jgi:hypothetical protein
VETRRPGEIGAAEYLWAAEQVSSYKGLTRFFYGDTRKFSSVRNALIRLGIYEHAGALFIDARGNPGPKRPPVPLIQGVGADSKPDLEEIKRHLKARNRQKRERAKAKENQHIKFASGPVAIFFVGDQHIGNSGSDWERIEKEQEVILDTPGSYCFQMGDLVDNFVIGKLIAENMKAGASIMEQWWVAEDYLHKFKDKLLAFLAGNHGMWTLKLAGIDYNKDITPDGVIYDSDYIRVTVHVGDFELKIWARHKWKYNSVLNPYHGMMTAAMRHNPYFDVYVGAHVHRGAMAGEFNLAGRKKLAIISGAYKLQDDWATEQGFAEHDNSTAVGLVIHEDGRYWASRDIQSIQDYMTTVYGKAD